MITMRMTQDFTLDGVLLEKDRELPCDEERAFILQKIGVAEPVVEKFAPFIGGKSQAEIDAEREAEEAKAAAEKAEKAKEQITGEHPGPGDDAPPADKE